MHNLSIREQIVQAVKARLEDMQKPTFQIEFNHVQRQPFTSISRGKKIVAAIFDDFERRIPDTDPVVRVDLELNIEFVVYVEKGEDPTTKLNMVLSETERALMTDRTFGNIAIDIRVDRTEHDIEGRFDKYAESTMFLIVNYRHNNADPRSVV